jgi:hypothetical protein
VQLMFYYVGFMAAGDVADYLIGLVVERLWPQASLMVFLALYFVFLWLAWLLAVRVTQPHLRSDPIRSDRSEGSSWPRCAAMTWRAL